MMGRVPPRVAMLARIDGGPMIRSCHNLPPRASSLDFSTIDSAQKAAMLPTVNADTIEDTYLSYNIPVSFDSQMVWRDK
jgi:hypothetical protein